MFQLELQNTRYLSVVVVNPYGDKRLIYSRDNKIDGKNRENMERREGSLAL